ncbi:MAG: prepilin-type N-terminal cleavage/methylation domain-containing protein [Candidatus Brocadia sp.]|nr:MAG: prepilin-type N-terminal cleavage/methylation domain-containing protein [Candidatus Brocadia sp.]
MRNQRGFSIIEIVIAIAVIAILAGVSIPVYVSMKPVIRLNGATRQIMEDLMWARMQAINQNNKFIIIYDNSKYKYSILDDDDNNGTCTAGAGESIITKYFRDDRDKLNPGKICGPYYDVTYSSSNANALIFHPRGNASNLTTITITNSSGTKTVSVAITGRVKKQ